MTKRAQGPVAVCITVRCDECGCLDVDHCDGCAGGTTVEYGDGYEYCRCSRVGIAYRAWLNGKLAELTARSIARGPVGSSTFAERMAR